MRSATTGSAVAWREDRIATLRLAGIVAAAALIRLAIAARFPLADDEAYYWLWSKHLAWGYPDHPPAIAAAIAIGTAIFGDGPLAVRSVTLLMGAAIPLLIYGAARDLFDQATALRAAVLATVLPVFALGTAFAFPDVPLAFFWTAGVWAGWHALRRGRWWWMLAGAAVGLALLSKLTALLLAGGIFGAWLGGRWRADLRNPFLYGGVAAALGLLAPVIAWNAGHDWWMVRTAVAGPTWIVPRSPPVNLLLYLAAKTAYYGPLVLPLAATSVVAARRRAEPAWRYLAWLTLPVFVAVTLSALSAQAKPHWPAPAYLIATIALGALWPDWSRRRRLLVWPPAVITVALTVVACLLVTLPVGLPLEEGFGRWDRLAAAATEQIDYPQTFILTDGYQAASQLAYALRGRVLVTSFRQAFRNWERPGELIGRPAVYVDDNGGEPDRPLGTICERAVRTETVDVAVGRSATVYRCGRFKGLARAVPFE